LLITRRVWARSCDAGAGLGLDVGVDVSVDGCRGGLAAGFLRTEEVIESL
jgi:hypothetical protein